MFLYESLIPILFCLFVTLVLPKLKTGVGTFLTLVLLAGFILINRILDPFSNFWLNILLPILVLIAGYLIVVANRFLNEFKIKKKAAMDSSGSDKTLGLFYQQQGMLDLASEKLQSIPRDGDTEDLLYKLGLEYEKKGQIEKALGIYKSIARGERDGEDSDGSIGTREPFVVDTDVGPKRDHLSAEAPETDDRETIGKYKIMEKVRQNATGAIFRGQDARTGTVAAIRAIGFSGIDEDHKSEIRDRLFRETECLPQLTHSNIATVYDWGEEPGMFYIASEYVKGEALKHYTKKGQLLQIRDVLSIIGKAAEALEHAHRKSVIHGNIGPDSIIKMKKTNDVKVKDFGIGWVSSAFGSETSALNETHFYMSPEQIAGKKVDGRSDIFSLGVVLFEMLTGERPFAGEDTTTVMLKISKEKHPSPRLYNPKIPRVIEKIVDHALEKDLENRYQTAGQLAIHLKKVVARIDELRASK